MDNHHHGPQTIVVGSTNTLKIQAVTNALEKLWPRRDRRIIPFAAKSEVPNQPIGWQEIITGANNRATDTKKRCSEYGIDACIGIENGIVPIELGGMIYLDAVAVIVLLPTRTAPLLALGPTVMLPENFCRQVLADKQGLLTIGQVLAEAFPTCRAEDPQRFLTQNQMPREIQLQHAITSALTSAFSQL